MQSLARHLQAAGRGNDTVLVHMSPREVGGLQALAKAAGGSLTTNPTTGLPEAGFLENMLPTLAGIAGGAMGVDPWIAGLGGAAVQTAITGDLGKGLMAGLGAYGGASIGYGLLGGSGRDTLGLNSSLKTEQALGQPDMKTDGGIYPSPAPTTPAISSTSGAPTSGTYLRNTSGVDPVNKGMWDNFSAASKAGSPFGDSETFSKMAPWAAALGVAAPLLNSSGPQTTPYNPATADTTPVYKGPYTPVPRKVIRNPQAAYDSSEHMYFDNVNPYGVVSHATGGLVALAEGGVTSSPAPDLYDPAGRGQLYGGGQQRTGRDYLDLINHGGGGPTSPRDFSYRPDTGGMGEKNYGIVMPKGTAMPWTDPAIGGGESGNHDTATTDPFANLPGTKVGDVIDVVGSGGGSGGGGGGGGFDGGATPSVPSTPVLPPKIPVVKPKIETVTGNEDPSQLGMPGDPITSAPSSSTGVPPTPAEPPKIPVVEKPKIETVTATEDGAVVSPSGGGGSSSPVDNSAYDPSQYGTSAGYDYSNWSPSDSSYSVHEPTRIGTSSVGEESLGTLQPGGGKSSSGLGALGDYAGSFLNSPKSWTGDNTLQAGVNLLNYVPGGSIAGPITGALEGFHLKDVAGDTGSGVGNLAGQSGFLQDMSRNATDWLYHNIFGGDYSAAEENAPFNDAANKASATVDKIYHGDNNAILNGAYGVHPGASANFNSIIDQMKSIFGGSAPSFDNTHMGWTGEPLNASLGGADLYTGMGANRFFGNEMAGDMGGAGGYGETEDAKLARTSLGNRWDGARGGIVGYAEGGPVHLGNNSFVVDARTVSEMGNGSSSAGQELLARLGGQPIHGSGDGVSDSIHANIGGSQEARVARDEVQFSPEAVARLGGGDTSKGSKFLYSLMAKARQARMEAAKKDGGRGVDTGLRALVGAG